MMKKVLLTAFLAFVSLMAYAQVTLSGKTMKENGEPVPFTIVVVKKNGVVKNNAESDFDGEYRITNLDPGTYDIEFQLAGFKTLLQQGVKLTSGIIKVDGVMEESATTLGEVVVKEYKIPIVKTDQTSQGATIGGEQIAKLPVKDVNSMVSMVAGVSSVEGGRPTIKGSRPGATDYYIDGVRVRGDNTVPANEIEQLQVITSGIEAKYGDVIGGLISITTKGPAKRFTGNVELETSEYLDAFGYNFGQVNFSGPLVSRSVVDGTGTKSKESIIGFRVSAQARTNKDANPTSAQIYRIKPDALARIEANPVQLIGVNATPVAAAESLTKENFDLLKIRPGNERRQYDFTGKLDFRLSKAVDVTVSGNYYKIEDQITPADGDGRTWRSFNSHLNPFEYTDRYRTNFRFRHRLGNDKSSKEKSTATRVENAQYVIQLGYEQDFFKRFDTRHEDRFFDYGYVGQFDASWNPAFNFTPRGITHSGYTRTLNSYKRAEINPVLANYNNGINVADNPNSVNVVNSTFILSNLNKVWDFHQNVGRVYNNFRKQEGNLYTGKFDASFDISPGGSKSKSHNIQFGFIYEQRRDHSWTLLPFGLWELARNSQDRGFNGTALDTTKVIRVDTIGGVPVNIYAPLLNNDVSPDILFYRKLRERVGGAPTSFGNVDNLRPEQLSLDMFSAFELTEFNVLDYYGYDYLGNKVGSNVTFKDFFTTKDPNTGARTFPVAPLQPIYLAGYVQDKFSFKDVIVNLGLRIDRYDANTKVMKDPYSLYEVMSAKEFYEGVLKSTKPESIGDDYKVYLSQKTYGKTGQTYKETDIYGYRQGDEWYTRGGQPIDPVSLFGTAKPNAKFKSDTFPLINQLNFDPDVSFEDYKPQTNLMPRLAISFPISDVANFFAHYDVLVARPPSNTGATALDYLFFDIPDRTPEDNPNLLPERTIDYEVGFQQKLNNYSGIKIATYYKELRDMIQLRYYRYLPAPQGVNEYLSYANVDFGTVKGFTFQYDLRPVGHVSGNFNYTLQFADGTGSDPASQRNLNRNGNIRTLSTLSYDERHRFAFTIDYRYDRDEKYDGPKLFGKEIFKDAGANLQLVTVSGRPYTQRRQPTPFGGSQNAGDINGARLPWVFNLDLRLDKTFALVKGKRPLNLNTYLRVQNLLDLQNIRGVYSASGSATDDGYLATARGKSDLESIKNSRAADFQAYIHSYQMRMINPDNFYQPRRIYLGCTFEF
jgi:hypothetical protein